MKKAIKNFLNKHEILRTITYFFTYNFLLLIVYSLAFIFIKNNSLLYVISYIITTLVYFMNHKYLLHDLKNLGKDFKKNYKSLIIIFILGTSLCLASTLLLNKTLGFTSTNEENIEQLLKNSKIIMTLNILLLAPIYEELPFRNIFNQAKNNRKLCMIISTIIFAVLHMDSATQPLEALFLREALAA